MIHTTHLVAPFPATLSLVTVSECQLIAFVNLAYHTSAKSSPCLSNFIGGCWELPIEIRIWIIERHRLWWSVLLRLLGCHHLVCHGTRHHAPWCLLVTHVLRRHGLPLHLRIHQGLTVGNWPHFKWWCNLWLLLLGQVGRLTIRILCLSTLHFLIHLYKIIIFSEYIRLL